MKHKNMIKFGMWTLIWLCGVSISWSQTQISGKVVELSEEGKQVPLIGANVSLLDQSLGEITDYSGQFTIAVPESEKHLVISYTGYQTDTVLVVPGKVMVIQMQPAVTLETVNVVYRKKSNEISYLDPLKIEEISEDELRKAACCNLSESFETSPSVDVSFTDAITGTRQIQMLGLASPYAQITSENMPSIRGLSAIQGLVFVPGSWVSGMQLNKGSGSVVNGYESISGQINIELKKPEQTDQIHANVYANEGGRLEGNLNMAHRFSPKTSTLLMVHGKKNALKHDRNQDGFMDMPIGTHFIGLNRWKFVPDDRWRFQMGVKATLMDNTAGQIDFDPAEIGTGGYNLWGMTNKVERIESWGKIGRLSDLPWKSMGLQFSAAYHNEENIFGRTLYNGEQSSLYANYIYQSILWNTMHGIKLGANIQYDKFKEILNDYDFQRTEIVPGVYGEYSYLPSDLFSFVLGMRIDHHNLYGTFITPRLHFRKAFNDESVLRGSIGRGQRTAAVIAENFGALASARHWMFEGQNENGAYGLDAEIAWNMGLNYTMPFTLDYKHGQFTIDVYRTVFENRVVVDLDRNPQEIVFYNLENESFANTLQAQIDYELLRFLDLRMAYRWVDSRVKYTSGWKDLPLNSRHRAFLNLAYRTPNEAWKFDATYNWQGSKRLPDASSNPEAYQWDSTSPSFSVVNAQITRLWGSSFEIYLGMENIFNVRQEKAIWANENPLGSYFDASMIWGPVFGRNTYLGLRYSFGSTGL